MICTNGSRGMSGHEQRSCVYIYCVWRALWVVAQGDDDDDDDDDGGGGGDDEDSESENPI